MACIDKKYCRICKKKTQHVSYPDNYYGVDEGCQECFQNKHDKIIAETEARKQEQIKAWSEMTLEEKVENLNSRLRDAEISNMTF